MDEASLSPRPSRLRRTLAFAARALPYCVSLVMLTAIFQYLDGFGELTRARWELIAVALLISGLLNIGLASFKLWLVLRSLGIPASPRRTLRLVLGLLSLTFFVPGQPLQMLVYGMGLRESEKLETTTAFEVVVYDRYISLLGLLVLIGTGWFLLPPDHVLAMAWVPIVALLGLATYWMGGLGRAIVQRLPRLRDRLLLPTRTIPIQRKLALLATAVLCQSSDIVIMWLALMALGTDLPFRTVYAVFPVAMLLSLMPFSISGMGIREPLGAVFLATWVAADTSLRSGLIVDAVEYVFPALVGLVALPSLLKTLRPLRGLTSNGDQRWKSIRYHSKG